MTGIVGKGIDRVDGRRKVTGAARYAADTPVADVAYAVIVSSTVAKGRVVGVDARRAESSPGVLAVMTHLNTAKLPAPPGGEKPSMTDRVLQLLQDDVVRYFGQPVAVAVADTFERATDTASRVELHYDAAAVAVEIEGEKGRSFEPKALGNAKPTYSRGDAARAFAHAAVKVEGTYSTPVETHNPMETHATIAVWQGPGALTVYDSTQGIFEVRRKLAATLALPADSVRVVSPFVGGGFGSKGSVWSHVVLAAMAARHVGRAVKLVVGRHQMFYFVGHRPRTEQVVRLAAARDGTLTALEHTGYSHTSSFDDFVEPFSRTSRMLYACPNVTTSQRLVRLDVGTPQFTRAPGESTGTYALESAMDELSYALALDPIALRLKNYAEADPESGKPWSSKSLRECYRLGAEKFGWPGRKPAPRSMLERGALVGWGMATATYPANFRAAKAAARIHADGTALVRSGSQDIGTGTYTVMAQIAADALGLPIERVRFELGDTTMPETPTSGGSVTAASVGSAVRAACVELRTKAARLAVADRASPLFGLGEDDVGAEGGRLIAKAGGRAEGYDALLARHGLRELDAEAEAKPDKEREKSSCHSFGAQFVAVRVDPDTGEVRVTRALGVFAAGHILNAKTARSQLIGGIVWGIGMALHEHTVYDHRSGRVVTHDLADYHVPVNADVPEVEIHTVDEQDAIINAVGVKGVGEIGITGAAAAVANAVYHATGKRVRALPITPDKLL